MPRKMLRKKIPATVFLSGFWVVASLCHAARTATAAIPGPDALQEISKGVLEDKSASQQRLLVKFAEHYQDQIPGVLAHLTLGYSSLQEKQYSEATKHFAAAGRLPTLVQDYAVYYQAVSEAALDNHTAAVSLLRDFPARYPTSALASQAMLQLGKSLVASGRPDEAIELLKIPKLDLPQPESTFLLAQAYQNNNQLKEGVATYRKVFYSYPASFYADDAEKVLNRLRRKMGRTYPASTAEMWVLRADKLYDSGQWRDALSAYRTLTTLAKGDLRDHARVRVSASQFHLRATWPALNSLSKLKVSEPEAAAERLYIMAAAYRRLGRRDRMEQRIKVLAEHYPKSQWYEKALLLAGNYYLLEKQYDRAVDYYRKSYENFPQGEQAAAVHWKVAWQAYRERHWSDARRLFAEHIENYPSSPQVSAALYWLGRLVEDESPGAAIRYYRKIDEAFPNYYYGMLARRRLVGLQSAKAGASAKIIPISQIQQTTETPNLRESTSIYEGPARERARLLESAWLIDWAIDEMQAVIDRNPAALWAGNEMARLEQERGDYHMALRYAKRYVPSYLQRGTSELPADVWGLLFPRPYWEQLKKQAAAAKVDPYLVAGLIRQESEFNPRARSRSNARGLMQLMPRTARMMARRVPDHKARRYRLASLYVPDINIVYGTFYLKKVLDQFDGVAEYALAGYNAGENKVQEWLQDGPFEEPAEFVESIPFTETRNYVEAVLRNAALYRQLYSQDN